MWLGDHGSIKFACCLFLLGEGLALRRSLVEQGVVLPIDRDPFHEREAIASEAQQKLQGAILSVWSPSCLICDFAPPADFIAKPN